MHEHAVDKELLLALGELVVAFSSLEESLHDGIWIMIKPGDHSTTILTYRLPYKTLVDKFAILYQTKRNDTETATAIRSFATHLEAVGNDRNAMIHSWWTFDVDTGEGRRIRRQINRSKGVRGEVVAITAGQVRAVTERVNSAEDKLWEYVIRLDDSTSYSEDPTA